MLAEETKLYISISTLWSSYPHHLEIEKIVTFYFHKKKKKEKHELRVFYFLVNIQTKKLNAKI